MLSTNALLTLEARVVIVGRFAPVPRTCIYLNVFLCCYAEHSLLLAVEFATAVNAEFFYASIGAFG